MKNCIKDKSLAQFDIVSLGEVMLRLDPGEDRIRTARTLRVWEGGGEYNVARGLKKCFGLRAGLVSAFAKNEVGYLIEPQSDSGQKLIAEYLRSSLQPPG